MLWDEHFSDGRLNFRPIYVYICIFLIKAFLHVKLHCSLTTSAKKHPGNRKTTLRLRQWWCFSATLSGKEQIRLLCFNPTCCEWCGRFWRVEWATWSRFIWCWLSDFFGFQYGVITVILWHRWNPANQLIGSISHYLEGFIHHRWRRISSINSSFFTRIKYQEHNISSSYVYT